VAQVVLHGREHVVLLRPLGNVLAMSVLNYESRVMKPSAFEDEVPQVAASRELIRASTAKRFDLAKYGDVYTERLKKLIEEGRWTGDRGTASPRASANDQPHGRTEGEPGDGPR
jgi:non-homologous end joining protein Ku